VVLAWFSCTDEGSSGVSEVVLVVWLVVVAGAVTVVFSVTVAGAGAVVVV
jgi:hypothetical protein